MWCLISLVCGDGGRSLVCRLRLGDCWNKVGKVLDKCPCCSILHTTYYIVHTT